MLNSPLEAAAVAEARSGWKWIRLGPPCQSRIRANVLAKGRRRFPRSPPIAFKKNRACLRPTDQPALRSAVVKMTGEGTKMTTDASGHARAATILARLDRLPGTRHVWLLITILSLGGMFGALYLFIP